MNQRKAGVALSYISMAINTLVGFISVPLVLYFVGKEQYGLYQLVGSMIGYLIVLDFGLSNTITRYYARYKARGDNASNENLLATAGVLYTFIAVLLVIAGFILFHFLLPLYTNTLSAGEMLAAKKIFIILMVNMCFYIPGLVFSAVITANEKFIFARGVIILNSIMQPLLIIAALSFKPDIVVLVVVQTLCNLFSVAVSVFYCFFKLKVRFKLHKWNVALVKEILLFSFFTFLAVIMTQLYWKSGPVVLGAVAGTVSVAVYSIAMKLGTMYMTFAAHAGNVFLPHISAISAQTEDMTEINKIFKKVGRIQFIIVALIFSGFLIFGQEFIKLWVGDSFSPAYIYTLIIMAAFFIPLTQTTGISVLEAKNKHAFRSVTNLALAVVNLLVSIPMAKKYGGLGCALTTGVCIFLGQAVILNFYYSKIGIKTAAFFKELFSMFVPAFICGVLFFFINPYIPQNFITFIFKIAAFSGIYAAVMYGFAFNDYERNLFLSPAKKILKRFSK